MEKEIGMKTDMKGYLLKHYEEDYNRIERVTGGLVKLNALLLLSVIVVTPISFFVFDSGVLPIVIISISVITNTIGVGSTFLSQSFKKKIEAIKAQY